MWWDRWSFLQCEQGCSCADTSARWERLPPLRALESLTFGSAIGVGKCTRTGCGTAPCRTATPLPDGRVLLHVLRGRLRLARLERLDTALDRRQGPAQVRLQLLELLHRVRLGVPNDLVRLRLGIADRLLRPGRRPGEARVLLHRRPRR